MVGVVTTASPMPDPEPEPVVAAPEPGNVGVAPRVIARHEKPRRLCYPYKF